MPKEAPGSCPDVVPGHPSIEIALANLPGRFPVWDALEGRLLIDVSHREPEAFGRAITEALRLIQA